MTAAACSGRSVRAPREILYDRMKTAVLGEPEDDTPIVYNAINYGDVFVGQIYGGTHTNVAPGKVVLKIDRRLIPEKDPSQVEADVRRIIESAVKSYPGTGVDIRRLLLSNAMNEAARGCPLYPCHRDHG